MQDNDFDKLFSHKFGQLPGEPYGEEQWSEISRRMDDHERRRRRWLLPVLLPLFGLLAGGNVFWWHQWREATQHTQAFNSQTTRIETDTVIHRTVVYHYDTIYQISTLVQSQVTSVPTALRPAATAEIPVSSSSSTANPVPGSRQLPFDSAQRHTPAGTSAQDNAPPTVAEAIPEHTEENSTPSDTTAQAIASRPTAPLTADTLLKDLIQNQPLPTKKTRPPVLYFARPRLGIGATLGLPQSSEGFIWGATLCTDIEIARNLRLGAEVGYQQGSLKSEETDALKKLEIEIPEPGNDFYLKYWEAGSVPAFTYALHLRYEIPLRGKWTPWIGLGVQAATNLPFEVEYEFENETTNLEFHDSAQTESGTHWQGALFRLGAGRRLNTRLLWSAESYLLQNFGEKPGLLDNQFGLKTSLFYTF
jgi:hypothetical protein